MATTYCFSNQGGQLGRIVLQIQAVRLAKRAPKGVTDHLAGIIVKPALPIFCDSRFQLVSEGNVQTLRIADFPKLATLGISPYPLPRYFWLRW